MRQNRERGLILLVLGQNEDGLTVTDLHQKIAGEMQLGRTLLRSEAYFQEVAIELAGLLRENLVMGRVDGRLALTEKGKEALRNLQPDTQENQIADSRTMQEPQIIASRHRIYVSHHLTRNSSGGVSTLVPVGKQ